MIIPILLSSQFTDEGGDAPTQLCDSPPASFTWPSGDTGLWSPGGWAPSPLTPLLQGEGR